MKTETLEAYRPLLRSILTLEGFEFENVFTFRVKGEEIVDALSGKSQFFDIGTKGNKLLKTLYQKWKSTQRPASVSLKDHIMSIYPILEDVDGMDFLGMLHDKSTGALTDREENLISLLCSEFAKNPEQSMGGSPDAGGSGGDSAATLGVEREAHQKEVRQILLRTRELEESLRVSEENLSSLQKLAEHLQETASREQQSRLRAEDELKKKEKDLTDRLREAESRSRAGGATDEGRGAAAQQELDETRSRLEAAESELAEARTTLERIEEERSTEQIEHSTELETLMGNISELQVREQELLGQIDSLRDSAAAAGKGAGETRRLSEERDKLRAEIRDLQATISRMEADAHGLTAARESLERRLRELSEAVDGKDEEIAHLRHGHSEASRVAAEREAEAAKLSSSLTARETELQQEKGITASLFLELEEARNERDGNQLKAEALDAQLTESRKQAERVEELEEALNLMEGRFQDSSDLLGTVMKSREKYRAALDSQVNPIFLLDRNLTILHLNRAMLSYTREHQFQQIIGKRCYEALGLPGICQGCPILKTIETGKLEANLVPMQMDGETRVFSVGAYPTLDAQSEVSSITEFLEEVTERVGTLEKLQRARLEEQRVISRMEANPLAYLRLCLENLAGKGGPVQVEVEGTDFKIKG